MRQGAGDRDDVALLRAVACGDEEALAALYDRHAGWLTVRLARRCAQPDVVDHAVQDTFLAVWREAGTYRRGGDVAARSPGSKPDPTGRRTAGKLGEHHDEFISRPGQACAPGGRAP